MNDELLRLIQGLNPDKFKDAEKTKAYFSNPEKYALAVDMLRQKHKPDADSAKWSAYIEKKYGNPFQQQEQPVAEPQPVAPEPTSAEVAQVEPAIAEAAQQQAAQTLANPYQQIMPEQVMIDNGQPLSSQPNVGPMAEITPEPAGIGGYEQILPDPKLTQYLPDASQQPKPELDFMGKVENNLGAFNHAVLNTIPSFLETVAATANKVDDTLPGTGENIKAKKTEDYATYKAAQWFRGKVKELLPVDEEYQKELAPQIAGGLGQVASIMLAAGSGNAPAALEQLGTKAPALLPAITEAAGQLSKAMLSRGGAVAGTQVFANEYRQAKEAGASDDVAFEAGIKNALVSSGLEQMPVLNALKRFNTATGGGVVKWLKNTSVEATEEMVTEVASEFYANLNAQQTYDKTRELTEGLKEAGETGYGVGFIMNGVLSALGAKSRAAKTNTEKQIIRLAIDETLAELDQAQRINVKLDEQGREYTTRQNENGQEVKVYKLGEIENDPKNYSQTGKRQTQGPQPVPASERRKLVDTGNGPDSRPAAETTAQPEAARPEPEVSGVEPDSEPVIKSVVEQPTNAEATPVQDNQVESEPVRENEVPVESEQPATVKESFTVGNSSYAVEKTDKGYTVTNTASGKELTNPKAANYKAAVKQYETKQQEAKQQEQRNNLIGTIRSLNQEIATGSTKTAAKSKVKLAKLNEQAENLGFTLQKEKAGPGWQLVDKTTGKPAQVKNTDTPTAPAADYKPLVERSPEVQELAGKLFTQAKENPAILQGLGLGISRKSELLGTISDIESGNNTNRAHKLLSILEKANTDGFFQVSTQEGAGVVRRSNPGIEEFLSSKTAPASASTGNELDTVFSSNKPVRDFIGSEGILNEDNTVNYDILHQKLNGKDLDGLAWVYDLSEQDIQNLKALTDEKRKSGDVRQPKQADNGSDQTAAGEPEGIAQPDYGSQGTDQATTAGPEVKPAARFDQERARIQEKRQSIKDRIKQKSQGQLNSLPVDLIGDYAELAATYVQEGIVSIKEITAKLKADHKALFADAEELTEDDIATILKQAKVKPQEAAAATKDRRHTQRLLSSPDLSEAFKSGITEQDKKYIPTTNELNSSEADAFIEIKGAEVATRDALDLDNGMHPATRALLRDKLIAHYDKLGTQHLQEDDEVTAELYFDKAESITSAKVERGTLLGQELQAYRFVANSSPERVLYNTRKQIDKVRKEELKKVKPTLDKKGKAVQDANKQSIAEALEKGNVRAAIQKAMKEEGINIAAVVKKHFTVVDRTGKTLADKLVEQSKLAGDEAKALAALVQKEFAAIATRKKQQLLKQTLTPKERLKPAKSKQLHDKIIELYNIGALSEQQLADLYADKMGLPKLTPEQTAKILKLADTAQRAKEGSPKHKALHDLLKYQESIKGFASVDLARSIWYANILSGYSTQMINAFANFNQTMGELYTSAAMNPKALPYLLNGLVQGYARGRWEALNVLKTGESPVKGGKLNIPNALERVTFKGGNWNPFNYLKYVQRIMEASDTFSYYGLKEMRAHELAYSKARAAGISKPTKEIWQDVTETLFNTSERKAEAEAMAIDEGLKGNDYKRRVFELMEQSRPMEMLEDTHDFAAFGTFNHDPVGTLGFLTDNIARVTGSVKGTSYIVPFTRIISNVANSYLDWSPYGMFRAAKGHTGNLLSSSDANKRYRKEYSAEERAKLLIKSGTGVLAATTLYSLSAPGEGEDEPLLQITANGPGDYKAQAELAESGWQRYSIKIGGTWYSYQNTPLAIPLSIIGRIRDDERYNGNSLENEAYAAKVGIYLISTFQYFTDMTFLKGVSEFLGAVNSSTPDQAGNYIKRTAANVAKSFIVPNLFTQISKEVQATAEIPMKDAPDILGKMVRDVPIARNHLNDMVNSLGEPVYPDTDRITSAQKDSPVWDVIIKNNAWIRKPNKGSIVIYDNGTERGLTDDEYFKFCKLRGQYIKQKVSENLAQLQRMDKEQVQENIKKWKTAATKKAKAELRR